MAEGSNLKMKEWSNCYKTGKIGGRITTATVLVLVVVGQEQQQPEQNHNTSGRSVCVILKTEWCLL